MNEHSPLSPEARAKNALGKAQSEDKWFHNLDIPHKLQVVVKRVAMGVYTDGSIHAGNFAYMALISVFSFFIVATAILGAFGESSSLATILDVFLVTLPPSAGDALRGPVEGAMQARTGPLLWISAIVGLWTTTSLIETFRDILHRSYGAEPDLYFWQYRLGSIVTIIGAVLLAMLAFSAQVGFSAAEEFVYRFFPSAQNILDYTALGQLIPFVILFCAIYVIFRRLTPRKYRQKQYMKWPGVAFVSLWWLLCSSLLPYFVANMANYNLTYGSLAAVMVTLIFFYLIGLGLVTGAQLNAALANASENSLSDADK